MNSLLEHVPVFKPIDESLINSTKSWRFVKVASIIYTQLRYGLYS